MAANKPKDKATSPSEYKGPNRALAEEMVAFLKTATYEEACGIYATLPDIPTVDDWLIAHIAKHDRFFLLTHILRRPDALDPWLYARTREVETDRYSKLDLWAREHYKDICNMTEVATPSGWKHHGELAIGDEVFSPEGKPVKVLATTEVFTDSEMYQLSFTDSQGTHTTEIHAGAGHLWDVELFCRERISGTKNDRVGWTKVTLSTKAMLPRTQAQQSVKSPQWYRLKVAGALKYPEKVLPVPPYTLGAWLGDGTCGTSRISNADDQLWDRVRAEGCHVGGDAEGKVNTQTRTVYGLIHGLREAGLATCASDTKHLPEEYQTASLTQRTALIQGLMDTDGSVTDRGDFVYTTTSETLAQGVKRLLWSLGVLAGVNAYRFDREGMPYTYYKVQFVPNTDVAFFSLDYHKMRVVKKKPEVCDRFWYLKDIQPAPTVPSKCIQVEGGRYVVGEQCIPTHNSTIITFAGTFQEIIEDPEVTIGIFSCTRPIAKAFLDQIKSECELNPMLHRLWPRIFWGPKEKAPTWGLDSGLLFKRKGNPKERSVEAWGIVDGQPTSKHFKIRLYDDVVTAENVGTPEMIHKTTERLELSFNLGTRESEGGREIYAGTRYAFGDTYQTLKERGVITPREHPATDDGTFDGKPVFLTQQEWDNKKQGTSRFTIACQQLLNPIAGSEQTFDPGHLRMYEVRPTVMNVYILVDPANSKKKGSNKTAMVVIGVDTHMNKYILDGICHQMKLSERWIALKALRAKWLRQPGVQLVKVGYEKYGMQTDIEHFQEMMKIESTHFEIIELSWTKDGLQSKVDRVQRLQPDFENWRLFIPYNYETAVILADLTGGERPDAKAKGQPTKLQAEAARLNHGYRVAKPIRRVNQEGQAYDVVHFFIYNEYLLFPSIHPDFLDAMSRIYDIGVAVPQIINAESLEPMPEPEY